MTNILQFKSNRYGTWVCEEYAIEFYDGLYHCFKNNEWIGPSFLTFEFAIRFLEEERTNAILNS